MSQERREAVQREADPIDRLRALLSEATPGPWTVRVDTWGDDGDTAHIPEVLTVAMCDGDAMAERDARLIAALRNAAPALLAVRDRLATIVREIEFRCAPGLALSGEARKARADLDALDATLREALP